MEIIPTVLFGVENGDQIAFVFEYGKVCVIKFHLDKLEVASE